MKAQDDGINLFLWTHRIYAAAVLYTIVDRSYSKEPACITTNPKENTADKVSVQYMLTNRVLKRNLKDRGAVSTELTSSVKSDERLMGLLFGMPYIPTPTRLFEKHMPRQIELVQMTLEYG